MKRSSIMLVGVSALAVALVGLTLARTATDATHTPHRDASAAVALTGYDAAATSGIGTHATTYVVPTSPAEEEGEITADLPKIKGGVFQLSYNVILNDNDAAGKANCMVVYEPGGSFTMVAYGFAMNGQVAVNNTSVISFPSTDTLRIKCTADPGTDLIGFNTDGSNRTTLTLIRLGSRSVHELPS
jgi:hypothetical protein